MVTVYDIKDREGNITRIYSGMDRKVHLRYIPCDGTPGPEHEISREEATLQLVAARMARKEIKRRVY